MEIIINPNDGGWKCKICGTGEIKPITLIPIEGTQKGNRVEAGVYHVDCINLVEINNKKTTGENLSIIGMSFIPKEESECSNEETRKDLEKS